MKTARVSFNGGIISNRAGFRIDTSKYKIGVQNLENMVPMVEGYLQRRDGLEFIGESKAEGARLIPFIFSEKESFIIEMGAGYFRFWDKGKLVSKDGTIIEVENPFTAEEIFELSYVQSADVIFFAHKNHYPKRLERYNIDNTDWKFVDLIVGSTQDPPSGLSGSATIHTTEGQEPSPDRRNYGYVVTAVNDETGEESIASSPVTVSGATSLDSLNYISLSWTVSSNSTLYNVYKDRENSGKYGYIGSASKGSFSDRGATPSQKDNPPEARNPFMGTGNYPCSVTFFEQRLVFGGTRNKPKTIYFSQTGNFNNFNISSPLKDDDAITLTLASGQINDIVWLHGGRKLQAGTIGGTWTITGIESGSMTPTAFNLREIGSLGAYPIKPIYLNGRTLYHQFDGNVIRELNYDFVSDSYIPADQTVFVKGLLEGKTVQDWGYQASPYKTNWIVYKDGSLLSFSYDVEQKLNAWSKHVSDGSFKSVAIIPNGEKEDVYFIIERGGKNFLERMTPYSIDQDIKDFTLLDSHLSFNFNTPQTEITGLNHLEGKTVSILGDGYVLPDKVVSNGSISLDNPVSKVCVGLNFNSEIIFLPDENEPSANYQSGVTLLISRVIRTIWAYLYKSSGGSYSLVNPEDDSYLINPQESEIIYQINEEPHLFTGTLELHTESVGGHRMTYKLLQNKPLPFNIMSTVTDVIFPKEQQNG